ncbi:MAG: glycosyltransferase family 2 protein [Acidobacteria bacterium]|nr:glycosyltransferase family 2 protein [Acidobacteriota bacterium]
MSSISVIVVNYNGAADLPVCLDSLRRQTLRPAEILLVDNHSSDNSLEIARQFKEVTLIENARNLGFSRAANRAAASAMGEILALLNTDVRLDPAFLEAGTRVMQDPDVVAAAAKILFFDRPKIINGVGGGMNWLGYGWDRGLNELDAGQYDRAEEVFFASGGACFLRRKLFLETGGFDDHFFMYHEDVDFCWRARLCGYRVITCPAAVVYHKYGATTRRELGWHRREILGERHNLRSLLKNYELSNALKAWTHILLLPLPWRRKWRQIENFLINLAWLPDTWRQRRRVQKMRRLNDDAIRQWILQSRIVPVAPVAPQARSTVTAKTS